MDGSSNSNYHAISAKLTQRFNKGLTYLVGFTWSKAIDGGSALRTNYGDTLWPTNSYNLKAERGLSSLCAGGFIDTRINALLDLTQGREAVVYCVGTGYPA